MKHPLFRIYFPVALCILIAWGILFTENKLPTKDIHLSSHRIKLSQALMGDTMQMISLLNEWHVDGIKSPQTITINTPPSTPIYNLFPQTYASASILLAIASPEQILAIPEGIRMHSILYPEAKMTLIKSNTNDFTAETFLLNPPNWVFAAPYTHPYWMQMIAKQGIPYCIHESPYDFLSLQLMITDIGIKAGREAEARFLNHFVESGLKAIDKSLIDWKQHHNSAKPIENVLFLFHYGQFSIPLENSLTNYLLHRIAEIAGIKLVHAAFNPNAINESLRLCKADIIIIACMDNDTSRNRILEQVRVDNFKIAFVDESILQSPTQHLLLAYYDLAWALMNG